MDIMLDIERLRETRKTLNRVTQEFEQAAEINNGLESAIGRPDGRNELMRRASDFESKWNRKRGTLSDNLKNIEEQIASIVDGWTEWDSCTAQELEGSVQPGGQQVPK